MPTRGAAGSVPVRLRRFPPTAVLIRSMAARPILLYPDPRLRLPCGPVTRFDADLRALVDDLQDTLAAAGALGITAAHVGVPLRVAVIDCGDGRGGVYVNPAVVWSSPEIVRHPEGSVSMPGVGEEVERPAAMRVEYAAIDGSPRTEQADGLLAVCLQHEIDQLDGLFWIGRLSRLKRERAIRRYEKLRRKAG